MVYLLKPKDMCKITIAGPKTVRDDTVAALHKFGFLHIEDYVRSEDETVDIGTPAKDAEKLSGNLVKLRSIKSHLKILKPGKSNSKKPIIKNSESAIETIEKEVVSRIDEIKDIDAELSNLCEKENLAGPILALGLDWAVFGSYNTLAHFTGYIKNSVDVSALKKEISSITDKQDVFVADYKGKRILSVFTKKETSEDVLAILAKHDFTEINTDGVSEFKGKPKDALKKISLRKQELQKKKEALLGELDSLGKNYASFVIDNEKTLSRNLEMSEAPLRFAETKNAFVIDGWVPKKEYAKLKNTILSASDERIYIKKSGETKGAPTVLENPKAVRPFEFFMGLYSLPKYTEVDPTFFMFLTFPLFFGFMLGDLGYGILTFFIFWAVRSRIDSKELKPVLSVMMFASFMTAVFGYIFGEFFGAEHIFGYELHPIFHRLHDPVGLLTISILIGVVHVNMGLIIGFYNELKAHGIKAALLEKASWMVLQAGGAVYAFVNPTAGAVLLLLAVMMITLGEGVRGLLELPSILANILSYSRLMAIGLASAILALVVNEMATMAFSAGILGAVMGVFILATGHTIAILLGMLSPFIHSMRLHYVEFFMKFYHGGGKRYNPFGGK